MKIVISGVAGSGKSSLAKGLAKRFDLTHHSVGDFMRKLAEQKGISLGELGKMAEEDEAIDRELDAMAIALNEKDGFVIDSRLGAFFIPSADVKIFLNCNDRVRAERIYHENRKGEAASSVEAIQNEIKAREDSEALRYYKYYGFDYRDAGQYDLVVDTSMKGIAEVEAEVVSFIKARMGAS